MDSGPAPRFHTLADRACDYLFQRGGTAPEEELARYVLGMATTAGPWRKMVWDALAGDPRLEYRDAQWVLVSGGEAAVRLTAGVFVALAVDAVGARVHRQRVVRIGAVRFTGERSIARFDQAVDPGRHIAHYVQEAADLPSPWTEDAPPFPRIAEDFLRFVGNDAIVGFAPDEDLALLARELARAGLPRLGQPAVDLLKVADILFPWEATRKPVVEGLASRLAVPVPRDRSAGGRARLAASVARKLFLAAGERGITTLQELDEAIARSASSRRVWPTPGLPRGVHSVLRYPISRLDDLPTCPGVYIFQDSGGQALYVGRASNLRSRVSSYAAGPMKYQRRMEGLNESIVQVELRQTGSVLEAALLEDQLIRGLRPRYNVQRRARGVKLYLRLSWADQFPRFRLAERNKADGALYVGPFRSERAARQALRLLLAAFPLATCTRRLDTRLLRRARPPCLRYRALCLGPCTGQVAPGEYRDLVGSALRLLAGQTTEALARIQDAIRNADGSGTAHRVAQLRDAHRRLLTFQIAGWPQDMPSLDDNFAVVRPLPAGDLEAYVFAGGSLVTRLTLPSRLPDDRLADRLARETLGPPAFAPGPSTEAIITRWLARLPPTYRTIRLPSQQPPPPP